MRTSLLFVWFSFHIILSLVFFLRFFFHSFLCLCILTSPNRLILSVTSFQLQFQYSAASLNSAFFQIIFFYNSWKSCEFRVTTGIIQDREKNVSAFYHWHIQSQLTRKRPAEKFFLLWNFFGMFACFFLMSIECRFSKSRSKEAEIYLQLHRCNWNWYWSIV